MHTRRSFFSVIVLAVVFSTTIASSSFSHLKIHGDELNDDSHSLKASSPFSAALQTLQKQIGYNFQTIGLLRRAMTHPSFSGANNRALSILGLNVIETSISLRFIKRDMDISAKDLNRKITRISQLDSCAKDGLALGLDKVVRVSSKTNSSLPSAVCGAFRAIFGAISVDADKIDDAGLVFWNVHSRSSAEEAVSQ